MFENIDKINRFDNAKRFMMFVISALAHALSILVLVILPLVYFSVLPEVALLTFLIAAPEPPAPPPPPTPPVADPAVPVQEITIHEISIPPAEIPHGIPQPGPETNIVTGWIGVHEASLAGIAEEAQTGIQGSVLRQIIGSTAMPKPVGLPPKPVARQIPQAVGGNVLDGKLIKRTEPSYPRMALLARVSGIVILQVSIDEEGNVEEVRVLSGHPLLTDEAVKAVKQWKYSPTLLNGEPVPVVGTVTVIFNLRRDG